MLPVFLRHVYDRPPRLCAAKPFVFLARFATNLTCQIEHLKYFVFFPFLFGGDMPLVPRRRVTQVRMSVSESQSQSILGKFRSLSIALAAVSAGYGIAHHGFKIVPVFV